MEEFSACVDNNWKGDKGTSPLLPASHTISGKLTEKNQVLEVRYFSHMSALWVLESLHWRRIPVRAAETFARPSSDNILAREHCPMHHFLVDFFHSGLSHTADQL